MGKIKIDSIKLIEHRDEELTNRFKDLNNKSNVFEEKLKDVHFTIFASTSFTIGLSMLILSKYFPLFLAPTFLLAPPLIAVVSEEALAYKMMINRKRGKEGKVVPFLYEIISKIKKPVSNIIDRTAQRRAKKKGIELEPQVCRQYIEYDELKKAVLPIFFEEDSITSEQCELIINDEFVSYDSIHNYDTYRIADDVQKFDYLRDLNEDLREKKVSSENNIRESIKQFEFHVPDEVLSGPINNLIKFLQEKKEYFLQEHYGCIDSPSSNIEFINEEIANNSRYMEELAEVNSDGLSKTIRFPIIKKCKENGQ